MLRRIARVLRLLSTGLGIALLACAVASLYAELTTTSHLGDEAAGVYVAGGSVVLWVADDTLVRGRSVLDVHAYDGSQGEFAGIAPFQTSMSVHGTLHFVKIPLWLLAAVCLAWPITSFIVARRRRRGRGFEVRTEVREHKLEVPGGHRTERP